MFFLSFAVPKLNLEWFSLPKDNEKEKNNDNSRENQVPVELFA